MKQEKVRPVFIYVAFIAIIVGSIGTLMLTGEITGQAIMGGRYSLEEISEHNSERDCWVYGNGNVYDITLFLQIYPKDLRDKCGGVLEIENELGKALQQYQIGTVD
tara:strand:- start:1053 stop:1370 length:318 start_codon:yes stop_codon:yes gene_type:complete